MASAHQQDSTTQSLHNMSLNDTTTEPVQQPSNNNIYASNSPTLDNNNNNNNNNSDNNTRGAGLQGFNNNNSSSNNTSNSNLANSNGTTGQTTNNTTTTITTASNDAKSIPKPNSNNNSKPNLSSQNSSSNSLTKKVSRHAHKDTTTKGKYSLNDFQILRTLGTGSFGRVHLTRSIHNGRFYAMKVLKKERVVNMKQVEHTNDERRMLKLAQHPFIIRMWGTFQDCHNLFMIMDYIEGGELFSLLRKSQRFPTPVAKFYAAETFLAIEYLHNLDIIYRDLKPENILLDKNGHIKLTDFGFAKEVQDVTYTLCGTPDYIAPEVVATKPYNKSVDWWSFGILIFEMLTGYTPFYDPTPMKTYENILNGTITYPDYLPPDILDLLQKLIVKDLTQRLGNLQGGSNDVKNHPWFKEVIWERLLSRDIETPYEPPITSGVGDTSQFDKYPEDKDLDYGISGVEDPYRDMFQDF
ncbi:Tpk1 catalytic subunit of cAMP-dependent protein kinase (PKA) [Candida orthopsilosis Co 90-125]|uniref:cAMP-dependent protein kinase n=1 Tax=Candida orthopsilosis (strain 90-125) TaxID=1136231 RepID=H8WXT8_CANO9|nr:Tpk1 catalytic subunit of cAMP-dependent protein kinase (PKA) [Candida orthopsilosis Co 90-125]CCG20885.1 Tpk1 catalytic subunit of cAMP-dependent protein kinase (PKA) [Candida orthopsilosis Co 90-125]